MLRHLKKIEGFIKLPTSGLLSSGIFNSASFLTELFYFFAMTLGAFWLIFFDANCRVKFQVRQLAISGLESPFITFPYFCFLPKLLIQGCISCLFSNFLEFLLNVTNFNSLAVAVLLSGSDLIVASKQRAKILLTLIDELILLQRTNWIFFNILVIKINVWCCFWGCYWISALIQILAIKALADNLTRKLPSSPFNYAWK